MSRKRSDAGRRRWLPAALTMACAAFLMMAAAAAPARAQNDSSLWPANSGGLFADNKARRPGDLLTVLVSERTQAVAQASTKASKSESATFGPGTGFLLKQIGRFGLEGGTDSNASGQTSRNGSLTARITVVVKSVDPNGNLVVEGEREVTVNAEKQKMVFHGRVRTADIQPDNTVASEFVGDATIRYEGKGPIGDKQRAGIVSRIFRILF